MPVNSPKVKFTTQADPALLAALRDMAKAEGCRLQTLIDEALREYVERKQARAPRHHVWKALDEGLLKYKEKIPNEETIQAIMEVKAGKTKKVTIEEIIERLK